jgi:hypothetical protein
MREVANFDIIGRGSMWHRNMPVGGKWSKSDIDTVPDIVTVMVARSCTMETENGPCVGCVELSEGSAEACGAEVPIGIEPVWIAGKEREPVVVVGNREVGRWEGRRFIFGMQEKSGARCL